MNEYDPDGSGFGNAVLYRMCKEKPGHTDLYIVRGKIWLIGRAYSATIERGAGQVNLKKGLKCIDIEKVKEIDTWIDSVSGIDEVNAENCQKVLEAHKNMVDFFCELIMKGQLPDDPAPQILKKRSLASKYLHFHKPNAFFLYDSIVAKTIRTRLAERSLNLAGVDEDVEVDREYNLFVRRCLLYRDEVMKKETGKARITPRQLDMALYPEELY